MKEERRIKSHRDLLVWQNGIELVEQLYLLMEKFPRPERFALISQVRRAAVSVPSNIAEGHARQHSAEFRQFLYRALAELDTHLTVALRLKYISEDDFGKVDGQLSELRRMINGLLARLTPFNGTLPQIERTGHAG